jgi:hypothetical protein
MSAISLTSNTLSLSVSSVCKNNIKSYNFNAITYDPDFEIVFSSTTLDPDFTVKVVGNSSILKEKFKSEALEQQYKGISSVLKEELSQLEDSKKIMIKQINDLNSQKEWVDWISKYGDDISN